MATTSRAWADRCRKLPALALAAALLVAGPVTLLSAPPAQAQCVRAGSDVTCSGTDPDGFPDDPGGRPPTPGTDDDLTITVESGAVVENSGTSPTIVLLENNVVTIEENGAVTAEGGSSAISGVDGIDPGGDPIRRNIVTNSGILVVTGTGSTAVSLGNFGQFTNAATGLVTVSAGLVGGDTTGVEVGNSGSVVNAGRIDVGGTNATGILASGSDATVGSSGSVIVTGTGAIGIRAREIDHTGTTTARGMNATGLFTNGNVANDGTVDVQGEGSVGVQGSQGATITNNSDISVQGDGTFGIFAGNGGSATNTGQIQVDGADAFGLVGGSSTRLVNSGTVSVTGDDSAAAVVAQRSTLDNGGTLDATGSANGVGVRLAGSQPTLTNSGIIRGDRAGVLFDDRTGPFVDTRFLINEAGGLIEATSGIGVLGGAVFDQVTNRGAINGDVQLGDGDDLFAWGDGSSVGGTIDGGADSDTLTLFQSDPNAPTSESFDLGSGTNFELLTIGNAGDTNVWTLTGSGSYANGISLSAGELRIDPAANISDTLAVSGGTLLLDNGANLPAGVAPTGGTVRLAPDAIVATDLTASGIAAVAIDGANTLQGNLSIDGTAVLESDFDSTGAGSRIDVDGDLTLGSTSVLRLQQSDSVLIAGSPSVRVATATGQQTGEFSQIRVLGSSPFLRGTPTYGSAAGLSFIDIAVTNFSGEALGRSRNGRSVGRHIDQAFAIGVNPEFQSFLDTLAPLDDAEVGSALEALHGAVYDAQTSTALATASRYAGMLARRPLRCEQLVSPYRRVHPSLAPCGERGLTPWVTGFGLFSDRNGGAGQEDWTHAGGGIAFGVDQRFADNWMVSGLVGASRSALDLDDDGDGSYTSFEAGVAAAWSHPGGTHVRGALDYGHGWHTTHRQISYPGVSQLALSDHDSDRFTVLAEVGHTFLFRPFEIEPIASLEYTYLSEEKTSESNAGVIGLDIDSRATSFLAMNTGVRASAALVKYAYWGEWLEWADGVWRPEILASWHQVLDGYDRDSDARLSGTPAGTEKFRVHTKDAEYGGILGGRLSFQPFGTRNTIELGYEAFVGDRTTSHSVMATLRIPL